METITTLMNRICNSGKLPEDFVQSIFTPISKIQKADQYSDFRTISLISHTSKILLHQNRITPIIKKHLAETQMDFRKGQGIQNTIFSLRAFSEVNKKMYV